MNTVMTISLYKSSIYTFVFILISGECETPSNTTTTATFFGPKGSDVCPSRAETCGFFRNKIFFYHKFVFVFCGVFLSVEQTDIAKQFFASTCSCDCAPHPPTKKKVSSSSISEMYSCNLIVGEET